MEEYCKSITSVLLFGNAEKLNNYKVKQVKTWLQQKNIDLCAEFYLFNNETHVIAYTMNLILASEGEE